MTFLTPHLGRNSGGVYAIERLATELALREAVHVAVAKGELRSLGRAVVAAAPGYDPELLPPADALIVPADVPEPERVLTLPADRGRPVVLLQGYGQPGNPNVSRSLELADLVLTGTGWLEEAARAHRCRTGRFCYGLDREVFAPGPPAAQRDPLVSMIVGAPDWKGAEDGLEALALVHRELPDADIALIGRERPAAGDSLRASWLAAPPAGRREIGAVMRRSAVFVCSSWEEGFGLPGIEALACGAALVTTDTKGSRDYAWNNSTARVVPPRRPRLLAREVVRLLADPARREAVARAGAEHVLDAHPPWPVAAAEFGDTLRALLEAPTAPRSPLHAGHRTHR